MNLLEELQARLPDFTLKRDGQNLFAYKETPKGTVGLQTTLVGKIDIAKLANQIKKAFKNV